MIHLLRQPIEPVDSFAEELKAVVVKQHTKMLTVGRTQELASSLFNLVLSDTGAFTLDFVFLFSRKKCLRRYELWSPFTPGTTSPIVWKG